MQLLKMIKNNFTKNDLINFFSKSKSYKLHVNQFLSHYTKNLMNLSSCKTHDSVF
jgi:hypothetical protein